MFLKERCPRCRGNLIFEKELHGERIYCLACDREVGQQVVELKRRNRQPKVEGKIV